MADLMVGGALLSSLMNVLFDRIASKDVLEFFRGNKETNLKKLKTMLQSADVLLNDAEQKQLGDNNVKKWLEDLKEVIYEADHVMDKINTEALRVKMEKGELESTTSKSLSFLKKFYNPFEKEVSSEVEKVLVTLDDLLAQTKYLDLKRVDMKTILLDKPHAPLLDDSKFYGRESDREAILKLVLSHDVVEHGISIIPTVGIGGIGKTTVVQRVYADAIVQQHFDLKAWVTISVDFDVLKIAKLIWKEISKNGSCDAEELHQVQNELKSALTGKKFLFVLDDVWNENYLLWDSLKSCFQYGEQGSKIIVTTRSNNIALMMKTNVQPYELKEMSEDNCWKLFAEHVNEGRPEFEEIGKQIVKKCKGLPLAVKSMAGLLRSMPTYEEWRHVLQSDIWELPNRLTMGIVPALWLSYHFLPSYLKPCFSHLSIFPKDYEFRKGDKDKIILIWMAEGLLQPQTRKRIEDVGEEYWNALISRSFFQRITRRAISMHDLLHDLAIYVSSQCCFIYDSCYDSRKLITSSKICHLSYMKDLKDTIEFENFSRVKHLRSLLALPLRRIQQSHETQLKLEMVLKDGGCLRTLSLSQSRITNLPDSIGNLKQLRYLDVSDTKIKELPLSICELYNLETLLLASCLVEQLPTNFSKLINLRHLVTRWTNLKEMPPNICNMTNLQRLSDFVLCKSDGSRIKELGKLGNLRGSLRISGLSCVNEVSDVFEGELKNKKYLDELILDWSGMADNSTKERDVLNALQPHVNLKKLEIHGYKGTNLPDWVTDPSYCNLKKVYLHCGNCCLSLLSFRQLSTLRYFRVFCLGVLDESRSISSNKPFPFLSSICLYGIDMLDWSFINTSDQRCEIFSCLKQFDLERCGKLNVALPGCDFPSLEVINVLRC
ncbi:putative disease resistance RPP13-like protein 1 [Cannabis sativa]|uniref:putative disease resistance RPP13-like protein 1 n=1 Tax=Cannabis sativa TaxID=3483 RepID=UPI0029CA20CD|nr:putative disease resistance RPP13-like protein 1 [Cannabis sativa]